MEHVFNNNNVLSLNYTADIVRNTELPDRDLIVYSTENEQRLQSVNYLGTLLYGLSVDATGVAYIAQTDVEIRPMVVRVHSNMGLPNSRTDRFSTKSPGSIVRERGLPSSDAPAL